MVNKVQTKISYFVYFHIETVMAQYMLCIFKFYTSFFLCFLVPAGIIPISLGDDAITLVDYNTFDVKHFIPELPVSPIYYKIHHNLLESFR